MRSFQKALTALGGIFFFALLLAALVPRAARGVAAALVQVTNTSANPVPTTSVSNLIPFFANMCAEPSPAFCQAPGFFQVPPTAPNGAPVKWLVIDQYQANCTLTAGNGPITPVMFFGVPKDNTLQGDIVQFFDFPTLPSAAGGANGSSVNAPVHIYVNPSFLVFANAALTPNSNGFCNMFVQGHLEI